ncbi:hypothetical protein HK099_000059 [Clydaea vesicula]|uniref:Uncharacterized protein n=1 Tax=Clydaea vesicula TaxID=447962 RepID=A0AAD5U7Q2_9FUNG|nr:hypothetical protein HK099_000059 [Clydaea vesicula]KAJ3389834.1 hypothetical protein HDU92_000856 [Lobulomyces angularis]
MTNRINHANDEKLRFISKEIDITDKNMQRLRHSIESYVRNQTRLRSKTIKMSEVFQDFSDSEAPALSEILSSIAEKLKEREKSREVMSNRISVMCGEPLKIYSTLCSKVKAELKIRDNAYDKQSRKKSSLDKMIINNSGDRSKINQAQLDLLSSSQVVHHSTNLLVESVERFEIQKRLDLKTCLSDFLWSEINFHAKALEGLTKLHQQIHLTNLNEDLIEINERINLASSRPGSPVRSLSNSPSKGHFSHENLSPTKKSYEENEVGGKKILFTNENSLSKRPSLKAGSY